MKKKGKKLMGHISKNSITPQQAKAMQGASMAIPAGMYFFNPSFYEKKGEAPVPDNRSYEEWLAKNPEIFDSFKSYVVNVVYIGDSNFEEAFTAIEGVYDITIPISRRHELVEAIRLDTLQEFKPYKNSDN